MTFFFFALESGRIEMDIPKKKYLYMIIAGFIGALAGFLYWRYIGCVSGSCPITSRWYTTTIWGALIGLAFFDSLT